MLDKCVSSVIDKHDQKRIIVDQDNAMYAVSGNCLIKKDTKTLVRALPDGYTGDTQCAGCDGILKKGTVIPKVSGIRLSASTYTYNGKTRTPGVTVTDAKGKKLTLNKDYNLTYAKGRKNVGKYSVKVTLKGNYAGSKTLYFTILPKGTTLKELTAGKKSLTVKWTKQTKEVSGYKIQYSKNSRFKNAKTLTVSGSKSVSKTIKKLTGGKKYYVRICTYKTVGKTKYCSAWSAKKTVKVKAKQIKEFPTGQVFFVKDLFMARNVTIIQLNI